MASWDDVRRVAMAMPETAERSGPEGIASWRVKDKLFAWERPLRRADLEALGAAAPAGPVLAVRVPDLGAKQALLAADADVYFSTPHFDGYPAILIRLDQISPAEVAEVVTDAWLARAPKRLVAQYLRGPVGHPG